MLKRRKEKLSDEATEQKPIRLWPGVVAVVLQWLVRFGVPIVVPEAVFFAVLGGLFGGLVIVVWWAFFSRAPRSERWGAVILIIVALIATSLIIHKSMRLMPFAAYIIPVLSLAFVVWSVASRRLSIVPRRAAMVATILLACGVWTLIRTGGVTAELHSDLAWRWAETPEERLLAQSGDKPMSLPSALVAAETGADWPGFRGPNRDSIIRGVRIGTDWSALPPVELWRRPIGPGWSSFAVRGALLYTQEQRGDDEIVTCYNVNTGEPVWRHRDKARFWESNAGAGPRGTPTLSNGRLYTFGGTGILNVLDASDGSVMWSRNAASDTKTKVPTWGFSSSPLVVDDVVIVAVAGSLIAYDLTIGNPRWFSATGGDCYSSPHLLSIDGVRQVLLLNKAGLSSVTAADGELLWEHPWPGQPIVQPALTSDGNLLLSAGQGKGMRRIAVALGQDGWKVEERWMSKRLRPYFNDFVVHKGHAFGFNSLSLTCVDVEDGKRKWKGGRYGGQLVLLADQDLLLVLSEKGELALVVAASDQFTEIARFPAIKGKTWNHPVLVGDVLIVRNSQEMAAFRLSLAGG
ncbi:MAG: PQQ-binding-like beta-propeller repeat protein [Planctomycetes bacterium]|nr:PQQ-binding-like beta-propeller repeat protein [Planctomycetota bacterium]